MKKVVYVAAIEMHDSDGVCQKILSQINALTSLGFDVVFCYLHKDGYAIVKNGVTSIHHLRFRYLFFYSLINDLKKDDLELFYVRNPSRFHYPSFSLFARKIKANIFLELPTYPIEKETYIIKRILGSMAFKVSWFSLKRNIKKIFYMGEGSELIWGLPAEEISNGIELETIPVNQMNHSTKINIIAIARMEYWHGYDRIIKSIHQLSDKSNIHLHVVGDNEPCLSDLKALVLSLDLSQYVTFHGALHGKELSSVFARCNLAVDALGRHRVGHKYNSSIKSKEYTARGIPFIKSHLDRDFDNADFVFNIEPDDENFDLDEVIKWLRNNNFKPCYIREFAKLNLTWIKKMEFIRKEFK